MVITGWQIIQENPAIKTYNAVSRMDFTGAKLLKFYLSLARVEMASLDSKIFYPEKK
jgi:hypothetical protein